MKTEKKKLSITKIKKNPKNPRFIKDSKFEALKKSLKEFPEMLEMRPIVVNQDLVILGGNMRYEASKAIGLKNIHVLIVEGLSEEQENEFVIKDNASFGDWDWDILANEYGQEPLTDWGLDIWEPEYDPALDPETSKNQVTDEDIEDAEGNKEHKPQATGSVTTICPKCGEEFEVQIN